MGDVRGKTATEVFFDGKPVGMVVEIKTAPLRYHRSSFQAAVYAHLMATAYSFVMPADVDEEAPWRP